MNRLFFMVIFFCAFGLSAKAQFYSVNVDKKTAVAMGESFNAEAAKYCKSTLTGSVSLLQYGSTQLSTISRIA